MLGISRFSVKIDIGTTFEKVLALISNIKENLDSIEAAPVVTTTDAMNSKLIANALVEGTRTHGCLSDIVL